MLRSSLALSLLTGQAFRMENIRAKRSKPGLKAQHLMSVRAAAEIGSAQTTGAELHSQNLTFEPGEVKAGEYHFRINTAGSTSLVLHTVYLPLALTGKESNVIIEGGTHVSNSPCFDFVQTNWAGYLRHIGLDIDVRMPRSGFYPRGGGRIEVTIAGTSRERLRPFNLERLTLPRRVEGVSAVAGLPEDIAERMADRARERLEKRKLDVEIHQEKWPGGPGAFLGLVVPSEPTPTMFFGLGERGKRAEAVADEAVAQVAAFLDQATPAVDIHSADQLVLPLALTPGASRFPVMEVTQHLLTNIEIMRSFLTREIEVDQGEEGAAWLTIH